MHNIYTLRGAKVRDSLKWSNYIDEMLHLFPETQVYFGSHHWPIWGEQAVQDFLAQQRDTYKYIHDQTLRLANKGYTPLLTGCLQMPPNNRFAADIHLGHELGCGAATCRLDPGRQCAAVYPLDILTGLLRGPDGNVAQLLQWEGSVTHACSRSMTRRVNRSL